MGPPDPAQGWAVTSHTPHLKYITNNQNDRQWKTKWYSRNGTQLDLA